jgi:UDPglucose 6-dehydrogenase
VEFVSDRYEAAAGAHALVIVTEWNEFRRLDFERLRGVMAGRVLVDLRNVYRPEDVEPFGFRYVGVGRGRPPAGA